jgi:hypothetical protein
MSRLAETRSAYDKLVELLDAEVRKRSGSTKDLERFQATLDVAFYLLGWAQFEYLVRQETDDLIDGRHGCHPLPAASRKGRPFASPLQGEVEQEPTRGKHSSLV